MEITAGSGTDKGLIVYGLIDEDTGKGERGKRYKEDEKGVGEEAED